MSIKDTNKKIIITDGLNGQPLKVIDFTDENNFYASVELNYRDISLLYEVLSTLNNEHGCLIKIGYKD